MTQKRVLPVVIAISLLVAGAASAGPITFGFTGTITEFDEFLGDMPSFPETSIFDGSIELGTSFSGEFTFDSDAVADTMTEGRANYPMVGPLLGGFVEVGNYRFTWDDFRIFVEDLSADRYHVGAFPVTTVGTIPSGFSTSDIDFAIGLIDLDGTALTSTDLPLTPPLVSEFELNVMALMGYIDTPVAGDTGDFTIQGTVETLFPVPEPSTVSLLALGLVGMAAGRRRIAARTH